MALYHFSAKALSRGSRNTVRAITYRAGCELYDQQTGQTFNYGDKAVSLGRETGTHNLTYMRRMNADSMLREQCYNDRHSISMEHEIIKMQERSMLEVQKQRIVEQEISRQKDRGFSMEM